MRWDRLRAAVTVATLAAGALAFTVTDAADAKGSYESSYGFDRTWNAGVRLVRVDMQLEVTEKDEANGYLLFQYTSPESRGKTVPGSMEFVRTRDGGPVRVVVQIPQMPGYHEQVLVDALARKLRAEYGDPPKRPSGGDKARDAGASDAEP